MTNAPMAVITDIVHSIARVYPSIEVYFEEIKETGEYFVLIDDRSIYYSEPFQSLLMHLTKELLWNNGIYNVYFGYEDLPAEITYEPFQPASIQFILDDFSIEKPAEQIKKASVVHDYLSDLSMAA